MSTDPPRTKPALRPLGLARGTMPKASPRALVPGLRLFCSPPRLRFPATGYSLTRIQEYAQEQHLNTAPSISTARNLAHGQAAISPALTQSLRVTGDSLEMSSAAANLCMPCGRRTCLDACRRALVTHLSQCPCRRDIGDV